MESQSDESGGAGKVNGCLVPSCTDRLNTVSAGVWLGRKAGRAHPGDGGHRYRRQALLRRRREVEYDVSLAHPTLRLAVGYAF